MNMAKNSSRTPDDHDSTILSSVHSSQPSQSDDISGEILDFIAGREASSLFFGSAVSAVSAPSSLSLSLDPSLVGSSLFPTEPSDDGHYDEDEDNGMFFTTQNDGRSRNNNYHYAPPAPNQAEGHAYPCSIGSINSLSSISCCSNDTVPENEGAVENTRISSFPADSFANIGRSLMLSLQSLDTENGDYNCNSSSMQRASSSQGHWWNNFQTDEDWGHFRATAHDFLNTFLMLQDTNVSQEWGRPKQAQTEIFFGLKWLQGLFNSLAGCRASHEDSLVSVAKEMTAIQHQLRQLPPTPPHLIYDSTHQHLGRITAQISGSTEILTVCSSSQSIPSNLICPICKDIVVGATLIDCQECDGSASNCGAVAFCWGCLEKMALMQCNQCDIDTIVCPFCNPNGASSLSSPLVRNCRPVPCLALDVAISSAVQSMCGGDGEENIRQQYYSRLAAWREETVCRRRVLEGEHDRYRENILAAVIDAEERVLWGHNCGSNVDQTEDHNPGEVCLMGSENDDGYIEVLDTEWPDWDEVSDYVIASQSKCSYKFRATCIAAATSLVGFLLATQTRRK